MSLQRLVRKLAVLLAPLALAAAAASTASAQSCAAGGCATGACNAGGCAAGACGVTAGYDGCATCQKKCCPPKFVVCTPEAPKIKFKCACPKPICDPCNLDPTGNYGYTPVCWRPWMAPPNYSHCIVPSPTQFMPGSNTDVEIAPLPTPLPPDNVLPPAPKLESQKAAPPKTLPNTVAETVAVSAHPKSVANVNPVPAAPVTVPNSNTISVTVPPPPPMTMDDVLSPPARAETRINLPPLR